MLSDALPDCFTPGNSALGTHGVGAWVGLRASLDCVEGNPFPFAGIEAWTFQPITDYSFLSAMKLLDICAKLRTVYSYVYKCMYVIIKRILLCVFLMKKWTTITL